MKDSEMIVTNVAKDVDYDVIEDIVSVAGLYDKINYSTAMGGYDKSIQLEES